MKIKILVILLMFGISLFSVEFIDAQKEIDIGISKLDSYEKIELETTRNKDGKVINDRWIGVRILDILKEFKITNYDQLCFISSDNYLVRISKEDILNSNAILALERNDKELKEENIRLIVPDMRDMFWIQDISRIKTEFISNMAFPHTIFFAESILDRIQIRDELPPFVKVSGYTFTEIMSEVFPFLKDEVLLVGKDGVKHSLDFEKYLKNAVLIKNESSFDLKSPNMPAGMWIKNLAYVQIFDVAVVFQQHFTSLSEVSELLNWNSIPSEVILHVEDASIKQISSNNFITKSWNKAEWLEW